jgi:hypothetical protein
MQTLRALCIGMIGAGASLAAPPAPAQSMRDLAGQIKAMQQQLQAQRERIEVLERELSNGRAPRPTAPPPARPAGLAQEAPAGAAGLDALDGSAMPAPLAPLDLAGLRGTGDPSAAPAPAVGAPPRARRAPEVAPIFEQPGVLTPRGKFVVEPSLQFSYSSSNRVALVGYTVIPALLIGLVDVREVKRNTTTAALTVRRGITNRFEIEAKLPYVYRSDATVSREIFTGTATETAFGNSGRGAGDAELAARYQLNNGGADQAYYIAGLRAKARTGKDPFEVITDCNQRCVGPNVTGTGLPLELPTGSGFYSLQPSLTWLFPSDPAIFFGGLSYLHNFKRHNVYRTVLGGQKEALGEVAPGDVLGFNFGMGLALNDKASFSIGYDHDSVARTRQNGVPVPGSVRVQLGTLLIGYSYRLSEKRTLNVSVGAGLTRDTPDVSLMLRLPITF